MALGLHNNNNLSVIVVPQLKQLMKVGVGVSAIAFTIVEKEKDDKLVDLLQWCRENSNQETFIKEYNIKVQNKIKKLVKVPKKKILEPVNFQSLYLTRSSSSSRQFLPKANELAPKTEAFQGDFISFDSQPDDLSMEVDEIEFRPSFKKPKKPNQEVYHPLVVKKIKGNPDRPNKSIKKKKL